MLTKLSSVTRTTYKGEAGEYALSYNISRNEGDLAKEIACVITSGSERVGYANIGSTGTLNVSLNTGMDGTTAKTLLAKVIDDAASIFDELNGTGNERSEG